MDKVFLTSEKGYFGEGEFKFGGCFIPEILYPALNDLQKAYKQIFQTKGFKKELKYLLKTFVGRPTPLIYAKNASAILGNEIYLKFEGLANTGAHKINNALAQVLLAKRMKKRHIIAETGAGQHGVAVASVCAFLKMPCTIFMGATDIQRQRPNVFIMEQFGAEVVAVESGTKTLKDAVNEALRQWSKSPYEYFYVLGSALGPYPYPDIVRDSQSIIGKEIKKQIRKALSKYANTLLPDYIIACVGGGSNAMGAFSAFLEDREVQLIGVEAGGDNFMANKHAMRLSQDCGASIGIAHGFRSYFLQDKHGQIANTHSISAGLDYAGVGPQLAHLSHVERVRFIGASDDMALEALQFFASHEGILPALESSHALAGAIEISKQEQNKIIVVNVSGRGDKDIFITAKALCANSWRDFLESELQSVEKILRQKNKPQEVIAEEEAKETENKQRTEELCLALQNISHDEMSLFDTMNKESDIKEDSISKDSDTKELNDSKELAEISQESLEIQDEPTQDIDTNEIDSYKSPLHFLTQDSNNIESSDVIEAENTNNREALHFLQDKELQNDKQNTQIAENQDANECEQEYIEIDSINASECVDLSMPMQDSESMQDFSQEMQTDTTCESISLESLLDEGNATDKDTKSKETQEHITNNAKNNIDKELDIDKTETKQNIDKTNTLAQQLSLELQSLSTKESMQALQALETQDSLNSESTSNINDTENSLQLLDDEISSNDVLQENVDSLDSNSDLDEIENIESLDSNENLDSKDLEAEVLESNNDSILQENMDSLDSNLDLETTENIDSLESNECLESLESHESLDSKDLEAEVLESSNDFTLDESLDSIESPLESIESKDELDFIENLDSNSYDFTHNEKSNLDFKIDFSNLSNSQDENKLVSNDRLESNDDLTLENDLDSINLESREDIEQKNNDEINAELDSIEELNLQENIESKIDLESTINLDSKLETANSLDSTSFIESKLDSTNNIENTESINHKEAINVAGDNTPTLIDETAIESGYSDYANVSAFDDMLGLQDTGIIKNSESLDVPDMSDMNETLEEDSIQDYMENEAPIFQNGMQDSITNDILQEYALKENLQDTMEEENIEILQEDLNIESEMPFSENATLQDGNIEQDESMLELETTLETSNNEVGIDSNLLDSDTENGDLLQNNITQEAEQDLESTNTDLIDTKEKQDSINIQELAIKQPLNYVAINPTAARVFKTAPELSKICGKSLKS